MGIEIDSGNSLPHKCVAQKKKYLVFVNLQQLFFMKIIVFFCSILHRQVQFFTFLAIKLQIELTKKLDDIGRASVHAIGH